MPFYTFSCNSCGKKFEVMCSIAEKEQNLIVCPACGASELDRVFEGFSVAVKGAKSACPRESGACPASGGCGCGNCAAHG